MSLRRKKCEHMHPHQKEPCCVFKVGGRSFHVYAEYDELGETYLAYPDFEETPEYTDDGRPFATASQESCLYCKPDDAGKPAPGDCGGCGWFFREATPFDPIGICMCDALRRRDGGRPTEGL